MQAVVIAAGRGTRMGPLTETRPKPLLPVAGRPIIEHVVEAAAAHVDEFVIVVGYRDEQLRERLGTYHGAPITYVEQPEPHGTAHAIAQARPHLDDAFLTLNGDVYITEDVVVQLVDATGTALAVQRVSNPSAYGVVEHDNTHVTGIVEKPQHPPSNLANLGLYRFTPEIFPAIEATPRSDRGEYEITTSLTHLLKNHTVQAVTYNGPWMDIGRPWDLLDATTHVLDDVDRQVDGTVESGATLNGPVVVEPGARVRDGVYIEGPVLIQEDADVGPNAYIRGHSVIGSEARVGHAVEIKNSILMAGTAVGHLSYVGDSILGANVNLGAGTTVANLRHDDATIHVQVKGESVDTNRRKFGVIIGDKSKTGINTSLNAGVTLGTETRTNPGETVTGDKNRNY